MTQPLRADSVVRIGTRTSKLALWQTAHVARLLEARHPGLRCELVRLVTQGDRRLDRPLPEIGGKGLFTAELEDALRRNEIDLAVHSLKDLPVEDSPGLAVGAVLSREDVRDALVARHSWTLETLPQGAVVGTSSLRRQAQLLAIRPDLTIRPIRGNVDTRIRKVQEGEYDAAVLAGAGLRRLGLEMHINQWLPLDVMLPAPGQGALAVQCRADDPRIRPLLAAIHEPAVKAATDAERHLLWLLGGGCSAPVAAWAEPASVPGTFTLRARVASTDGARVLNAHASGADAHELAARVASALRDQGADAVLATAAPPPLAGKRVVVTRPQHQVGELVAALQQRGARVVVAPAAQIIPLADLSPLDAALERLDDYRWVVFTSANAVETVCTRPAARRLADHAPQVRIAAVGPSTVDALSDQGIAADFVPSCYDGDHLAAELPLHTGDRILLPRSAIARAEVVDRLRERGAVVDEIAVYTTADASLSPDALDQLRQGWDAVTFTSGSTVQGFLRAIAGEKGLVDHLRRGVIACIGPKTADAIQALGYSPQVVATEHTAAGLVAALADHFDGS